MTKKVKFYAQAEKAGMITTSDLAKEISGRCSLTYGDILNVFKNLEEIVPKYLSMGFHVNLQWLGILYVTLQSQGTETEKEFTADKIKKLGFHLWWAKDLKQAVKDIISLEKITDKKSDEETSSAGD